MQRDFMDGAICEVPGTLAVIPPIARLLAAFRQSERPIVHVVRIYQEDGSNVDLCRRAAVAAGANIVRPGGTGVAIPESLVEASLDTTLLLKGGLQHIGWREWAMYKPRWGAFYQTPLEAHLKSFAVSTTIFAGCNFPNCPRTSIYEASERDFRVVMADDAVSGVYDKGRDEMTNIGVSLLSADDIADRILAASGEERRRDHVPR